MPTQKPVFAIFTRSEQRVVDRIIDRTMRELDTTWYATKLDVQMDLSATHRTNPLRLFELATADSFNFLHDMRGIHNCLNRETGQLERNFLPRYSA